MYAISEHGSWRDHQKKRNTEKRGQDTSQRVLRFKGPLSGRDQCKSQRKCGQKRSEEDGNMC